MTETVPSPLGSSAHLPLMRAFPALVDRVPFVPLGVWPTPVDRLTRLGHDRLWVKREDLSSPLYGGNKVRKLEFALADVLRTSSRRVMTMGGLGTNHGVATVLFGQRLGLTVRLLLYPQPITEDVRRKLLVCHAHGATLQRYRSLLASGVALHLTARALHPREYVLPAGASSPIGTIGVVNAMFELRDQIAVGAMPEPDVIVCALGSSGTVAGLQLGASLAGLKSRVIAVRSVIDHAGPVSITNRGTVEALMRRTLALLRRSAPSISDVPITPPDVLDGYFGRGYGVPTAESRAAAAWMRDAEGIVLDDAYTAKTAAALRDIVSRAEYAKATILYWHTYCATDLAGLQRTADYRQLPRALHSVFAAR